MGKIGEHREAKQFSVYLIENTVNSKVYVGITSKTLEERYRVHLSCCNRKRLHCVHLYPAMLKYGTDKFSIRLIDVSDSWGGACEKERFYIKKFDSYNSGYNASPGGDGLPGFKWPLEKCIGVWKKFGDTQVCVACQVEKPISDFPTRNHAHRGDFRRRPIAECKKCTSERSGRYAKANRSKVNLWKRNSRNKQKEMSWESAVVAAT